MDEKRHAWLLAKNSGENSFWVPSLSESEEALQIANKVESGKLSLENVRLASYLGYPAARRVVGIGGRLNIRTSFQTRSWLAALHRWGRDVLVRAGIAFVDLHVKELSRVEPDLRNELIERVGPLQRWLTENDSEPIEESAVDSQSDLIACMLFRGRLGSYRTWPIQLVELTQSVQRDQIAANCLEQAFDCSLKENQGSLDHKAIQDRVSNWLSLWALDYEDPFQSFCGWSK